MTNDTKQLMDALYTSYVNITRKQGKRPIEKRLFVARLRMWEW